jgi:hypothetical protein
MQINPHILAAAKAVVLGEPETTMPSQVPGYTGILVGLADQSEIQAFTFFDHDGVRYAVGTNKK